MTQRAVLQPRQVDERFRLSRCLVGEALEPWLDFHWIIEWDLPPGEAHTQRVLPFPNHHLVFEAGETALHGLSRGVYERHLHGRGRVHGLRFKCGGLRPWLGGPLQALSGRRAAPTPCLPPGADLPQVEAQVLQAASHDEAVAAVEALLCSRLPAVDPWVARLNDAVLAVQADPAITRTVFLQQRLGLGERALQRCFANYLGASPKWVIQRARLQDALLALSAEAEVPLAELALRLGFCDQAHFSRCFRQHTGLTPQRYRRAAAVAAA